MNFEEFAGLYCERQRQTVEGLRAVLAAQKKRFRCDGWMLLECQVMDGSRLGERTIIPFGPENTFKEPSDKPISPRGLASDIATSIGVLMAEDLPKRAKGN